MTVPASLEHRIDAVIDEAITTGRIVGTVVMVNRNGSLIYARAAGHADREAGIPTSTDTLFRLGSLAKPLTACTALALWERGRIQLDDPVTRFLPDFTPALADGRSPTITIRHLLTHTAGMAYPSPVPGDSYHAAKVSGGLDQPGLSMEENLARIASATLYSTPGSVWRYSVAIDILGAVIAAVHGGTLAEAVGEFVTGPLGMSDTDFVVRDRERLAVAYADGTPTAVRMHEPHVFGADTMSPGAFSPARIFDERSFQSGGAGMAGTAGDYMIFLETLRTGGGPVLQPETVAMAFSNQIGDLRQRDEPGWGFGFFSGVMTDAFLANSPGSTGTILWGGVWGNGWFVDPAAGLTVCSFSNTALEGCLGGYPRDIWSSAVAATQFQPPAS